MKILTPEQALQLDQWTFQRADCSSEDFIRRAGISVADWILKMDLGSTNAMVLCGPGNNGRDGLAAAEHLQKNGWQVETFRFSKTDPNPGSDIARRLRAIDRKMIVIDALFGIGLSRPLAKSWSPVFEAMEEKRRNKMAMVISVDTPSGLNAKTGREWGPCVHADWTLTMQAAKLGFFQNEGRKYCGHIKIFPLPYPAELLNKINAIEGIGRGWARRHLPPRALDGNKGTFGRLNLVAGSKSYPGAAILAAKSALRSGVGYVNVIQFDRSPVDWFALPEALREEWNGLPRKWERPGTWCLGPGATDQKQLLRLLQKLLQSGCKKVVLDATALSLVPSALSALVPVAPPAVARSASSEVARSAKRLLPKLHQKLPEEWILTPHPKELAEMLGVSVSEIQTDRLAAITEATERFGGTFVLKGYKTLICQNNHARLSLRGNSCLAKAGSGDVLSGIISGFREQGLASPDAAALGVVVHALAGDLWCRTRDASSLTPSEMIDLLPLVLRELRHGL